MYASVWLMSSDSHGMCSPDWFLSTYQVISPKSQNVSAAVLTNTGRSPRTCCSPRVLAGLPVYGAKMVGLAPMATYRPLAAGVPHHQQRHSLLLLEYNMYKILDDEEWELETDLCYVYWCLVFLFSICAYLTNTTPKIRIPVRRMLKGIVTYA